MANNVIHGIGKPRIVSTNTSYVTDSVASGGATTVVLTTGGYTNAQVEGRLIETKDTNNDTIYGKATDWASGTKTITVDEWIGGNPATGNTPSTSKAVYIKGSVVDLPVPQSFREGMVIDAIYHQLYNGNRHITKRGWYYGAVLDYSKHLTKAQFESLELLFNSNEGHFSFYPRKDNPNIRYDVNFPENYSLEWFQKKARFGHGGVILRFRGMRRLTDVDLTTASGYTEYGYGEFYGYIH